MKTNSDSVRIEYPQRQVFYPGMGVTLSRFLIDTGCDRSLRFTHTVDLSRDWREKK